MSEGRHALVARGAESEPIATGESEEDILLWAMSNGYLVAEDGSDVDPRFATLAVLQPEFDIVPLERASERKGG